MLKNTWKFMTLAVLLLTISGWAMAGNLEPPGGPAPTMKSLQEIYDKVTIGTEITSLPHTISSPGFYYITQDLTSPAGSHGITISVDNVTLDLMGFNLVGVGGTGNYDGIYMYRRTNVEIRNGTVRNFSRHGIYGADPTSRGHRIINVRTMGNGSRGVYLSGRANLIEGCTSLFNGSHGIDVGPSSTVTRNTIFLNGFHGVNGYRGLIITGNTIFANNQSGIVTSEGSTIIGNTSYKNSVTGIFAGRGSTVTSNTAYENGHNGIDARWGSTVIGNTARDNQGTGILIDGNSLVDQNTATNNWYNMNFDAVLSTYGTNHAPLPKDDINPPW